jgi:uncharacterized membrane protein YbhN (UPF0104 family)
LIVLAGASLTLGLVTSRGPAALSAIPAVVALLGIALCLFFASRRGGGSEVGAGGDVHGRGRRSRLRSSGELIGDAVREAVRLVRMGDPRLAGAIAYWVFDAAVLWAMLHALGSRPALPVVALAYLVGQAATTLPIPGSVTGGIAGVLIAFGVPAAVALPSVLAYRAIAVWLPMPVALAAVPRLRATIAGWGRDDAAALARARDH